MGIAHCPEARRLFPEMSVEENLDMGSLRGRAKSKGRIQKKWYSSFSKAQGAQQAACRDVKRRRAADACCRQRAYVIAQTAHV